jgi:hypothetical protein
MILTTSLSHACDIRDDSNSWKHQLTDDAGTSSDRGVCWTCEGEVMNNLKQSQGQMEMHLVTLSSVNSILSMIDLKAKSAAISNGQNLIPCDVDPNLRLTFYEGVLGGVAPPKDREFPPMQFLVCYVLPLAQHQRQTIARE